MGKIGVGIIGLGMGKSMFGIRQIPDTTLEIRGICDTDADRLESIRTEHNVPFATMDYQELLQRTKNCFSVMKSTSLVSTRRIRFTHSTALMFLIVVSM